MTARRRPAPAPYMVCGAADATVGPFPRRIKPMAFAYSLPRASVHRFRDMPSVARVSEATARRRVDELVEMGLAERGNGSFTVRHDAICQPIEILDAMYPSLLALGRTRRFAGPRGTSGIAFARRHLPPGSFVTLDYPLARLTGYRPARDYCAYVDDQAAFASLLLENGFREDRTGRVVVMPKMGKFGDRKLRLFLDCLAAGGPLCAGAVELYILYGNKLPQRAVLDADSILEVLHRDPSLVHRVAPEPCVCGTCRWCMNYKAMWEPWKAALEAGSAKGFK